MEQGSLSLLGVPVENSRDEIVSLDLYFSNESNSPLEVQGQIKQSGAPVFDAFFLVDQRDPGFLMTLPWESINDRPQFQFSVKQTNPVPDTLESFTVSYRLKPAAFIRKKRFSEAFDKEIFRIELAACLPGNPSVNLKMEAKKLVTKSYNSPRELVRNNQVIIKSLLQSELDLHIETLSPGDARRSNAEILRIQLQAFETYLQQVILTGTSPVYIIHGLGEGILKNAIADILVDYADILCYSNEYHPRYGFGATEIKLV